jgi:lambda family phage portal protein
VTVVPETAPAGAGVSAGVGEKPRVRVRAGSSTSVQPRAMTAYEGASRTSQATGLWNPTLASPDAEYAFERDTIVARARDLVRNDGAASAAVTRAADLVVGHRFVLAAKPDGEALGLDRTIARQLGRAMEREWRAWADDPRRFCHRQRRLSFAAMLTLMARQVAGPEGEALAVLGWRADYAERGARYATCLDVIDPDRLSNPMGVLDGDLMRSGIELDPDGAPLAAHIQKRHPLDLPNSPQAMIWERVPWETDWGRPVVVHWFEHERAGQSRGVTRFASILAGFRQLAKYTEAELQNAVLNAMFGAFVKTGADAAAIAQAMSTESESASQYLLDERTNVYEKAPVVMNGLRVPVLAPGDEIQMNTAARATGDYVNFRAAFLQSVASALGLSYEQLAMDFSKTNYSSARAALNEVWRTVLARRQGLSQAVAQPLYFAVMEEAFARGYIETPPGAPSFDERPDAYCRAMWIGPSRGSIDPVKDLQAAQMGVDTCLSTLEQECAERGLDYEDVLDQLAYEAEQRAARGIAPVPSAVYGVVPPSDMPATPANVSDND